MTNWNTYMRQAYSLAYLSKDASTQNGAVLLNRYGDLIAGGMSNFPPKIFNNVERWERPAKYRFVEHAERTAIFNAVHDNEKVRGGTLVCPWAACADCARAIVMTGITRLVRAKRPHLDLSDDHEHWDASIRNGDLIMIESGVEVIDIDYVHTGEPITLLKNGNEYTLTSS